MAELSCRPGDMLGDEKLILTSKSNLADAHVFVNDFRNANGKKMKNEFLFLFDLLRRPKTIDELIEIYVCICVWYVVQSTCLG